MSKKLTAARIKKYGLTFEISVDSDRALEYKRGQAELDEVLLADHIFSDAHKGLIAPQEDLKKAFATTDINKIADIILKQGEIQLSAEHRSVEREQKLRRIIDLIHRQAIDARTKLPIPPQRIESALEEAKVHLEEHKTAEEQLEGVISKLRPILPISIEQKEMVVLIPAQHTGKTYNFVKSNSKIISEEWTNDGSWRAKIKITAGMQQEFIDKLNSLTRGEAVVQ
ncbi:MAG TPA: ribosome assembly factor SBDS [Candidatus Nanoarchaeia archaeon]|nr:ribosome assembly factor SBDS [Candidatus Nanoarchaeia archaeon]